MTKPPTLTKKRKAASASNVTAASTAAAKDKVPPTKKRKLVNKYRAKLHQSYVNPVSDDAFLVISLWRAIMDSLPFYWVWPPLDASEGVATGK